MSFESEESEGTVSASPLDMTHDEWPRDNLDRFCRKHVPVLSHLLRSQNSDLEEIDATRMATVTVTEAYRMAAAEYEKRQHRVERWMPRIGATLTTIYAAWSLVETVASTKLGGMSVEMVKNGVGIVGLASLGTWAVIMSPHYTGETNYDFQFKNWLSGARLLDRNGPGNSIVSDDAQAMLKRDIPNYASALEAAKKNPVPVPA